MNQISLFHLAYYVSFKVSYTSSNLLLWILGDVDRISCLLHITILWYHYTCHHELCCVQSLRPVLFNSKVVFSTISLARFEVLSVELLKIGVFLDVMMHHWVSSSQQLRWSHCLQNIRNYLPQQHKTTSQNTWILSPQSCHPLGWLRNSSMEGCVSPCFPMSPVVFVSLSLFNCTLTSNLSPMSDCLWWSSLVRPRRGIKILYL